MVGIGVKFLWTHAITLEQNFKSVRWKLNQCNKKRHYRGNDGRQSGGERNMLYW